MDNIGTEVARFVNAYKAAIDSQLGGIQETLRADDAHTLKATLIESGILERGVARERNALVRIAKQRHQQAVEKAEEENATLTQTSTAAVLPSLGRLQAAVELLLGTNYHLPDSSKNNSNSNGSVLVAAPPPSFESMMSVEQRSIVQLRLQLLFEDINAAVTKLQRATHQSGDGDEGFESSEGDDDDDDDFQILRHHINPNASSVTGEERHASVRKPTLLTSLGTAAAEASAAHASSRFDKVNTKSGKGAFRSLKKKSLLPSDVVDLQLLCEDLHEKEFTATQKLRISEAQKEELLFRLNAREETLRGLRTHFLRELVETVGSRGDGNTSATTSAAHVSAAARFAGIPITFIEERDIEVARRVANAQLELDQIRSEHGKQLWLQREGWMRRLDAKEKEIIQMQIMFRNALAALQGKHASVVSKIVDENSNLKNTNVQVEHMALQRAEAFFEMKLNEKIAQLTSQYEGKLGLLEDKLAAANDAFRQSLSELKAERKARRKVDKKLQETEQLLDHALLVEIPFEGERASKGLAAELANLQKVNEELTATIVRMDLERSEEKEKWENEMKAARDTLESSRGDLQALDLRLSVSQNDLNQIKSQRQRAHAELAEKEQQLRAAQNELTILKDKLKANNIFLEMSSNDFTADDERESQLKRERENALLIEKLKSENEHLQGELTMLKNARDSLNRESTNLTKRALEAEQELQRRLKNNKDDEELSNLKARYDAANKKCDEYREVIAQLQREINDRDAELEEMTKRQNMAERPSSRASLRFGNNPQTVSDTASAGSISGRASPLGLASATPHPYTNVNSIITDMPPPSRASSRSNVFRIQPPMVSVETNTTPLHFLLSSKTSTKQTSDIGIQLSTFKADSSLFFGNNVEGEDDVPSSFLAPQRQLNAKLRRQLADLNAQLRITCNEQNLRTCATVEAIFAAMSTPSSVLLSSNKTNSMQSKREGNHSEEENPANETKTATGSMRSEDFHSAQNKNKKRNSKSDDNIIDPIIEMLPIPLSRASDLDDQNEAFQREVDRRVQMLSEAIQHLVESSDNLLAEDEQFFLLQQHDQLNSRQHQLPPQHPSSSRPHSAHVRYSIGALPMSRLGTSTGSRESTPTRVGGGFVISHRPHSGKTPHTLHHQKGRAPPLHSGGAPSLADMGVYEDEIDDILHSGEENVTAGHIHPKGTINNTSSIPIVEPHYDQDTNMRDFYDANGLPKYVWGIDKRLNRSDTGVINARTTGGAVKGKLLMPRAPLAPPQTPRPPSAANLHEENEAADPITTNDGQLRYIIQPQSFFTVRNRLLNGAPDQQRWEMSSAQIRKSATKGLCRGHSATRRVGAESLSPRYRPLPQSNELSSAETDTLAANIRDQNLSADPAATNRVVFSTSMVKSLSRPSTAGPVRPISVLELSNKSGR